jgi:hypothetical protein
MGITSSVVNPNLLPISSKKSLSAWSRIHRRQLPVSGFGRMTTSSEVYQYIIYRLSLLHMLFNISFNIQINIDSRQNLGGCLVIMYYVAESVLGIEAKKV